MRGLAAIGVWCPDGMANRRVSRSDMTGGPCWSPAWIRRNTTPKCFVLGLVQVSDLERVAQFRNPRGWRIEQIVGFRGDTDGLLLYRGS